MAKIGERFVDDMIDRGRRELGAVMYSDSNVAQPMYPLRGGYAVAQEARDTEKEVSSLADRLQEPAVEPGEPDRDERDRGMELE